MALRNHSKTRTLFSSSSTAFHSTLSSMIFCRSLCILMKKEILYPLGFKGFNTLIFPFELYCQFFQAPLWMLAFPYQNRNCVKHRWGALGLMHVRVRHHITWTIWGPGVRRIGSRPIERNHTPSCSTSRILRLRSDQRWGALGPSKVQVISGRSLTPYGLLIDIQKLVHVK